MRYRDQIDFKMEQILPRNQYRKINIILFVSYHANLSNRGAL